MNINFWLILYHNHNFYCILIIIFVRMRSKTYIHVIYHTLQRKFKDGDQTLRW